MSVYFEIICRDMWADTHGRSELSCGCMQQSEWNMFYWTFQRQHAASPRSEVSIKCPSGCIYSQKHAERRCLYLFFPSMDIDGTGPINRYMLHY